VRRTLSGGRCNSKTEAELSALARPEAFDDSWLGRSSPGGMAVSEMQGRHRSRRFWTTRRRMARFVKASSTE
jgi:hypothetical protein